MRLHDIKMSDNYSVEKKRVAIYILKNWPFYDLFSKEGQDDILYFRNKNRESVGTLYLDSYAINACSMNLEEYQHGMIQDWTPNLRITYP